MMELIDIYIQIQKQTLEAQEKGVAAAKQMLKTTESMAAMQKAAAQATDANVKAWKGWMSLWGWRQ